MQLTLLASFLERSSLQKIAFPFRTKGLFSTEPWHDDRRQVNSVCPEALWKDVKRIYVIGKRAKVDLQETSRYFQLISLELSYIITTHHSHNNMRMRAWICWSQVQNEVLIHAQIIPGFIKQSIQFRKTCGQIWTPAHQNLQLRPGLDESSSWLVRWGWTFAPRCLSFFGVATKWNLDTSCRTVGDFRVMMVRPNGYNIINIDTIFDSIWSWNLIIFFGASWQGFLVLKQMLRIHRLNVIEGHLLSVWAKQFDFT